MALALKVKKYLDLAEGKVPMDASMTKEEAEKLEMDQLKLSQLIVGSLSTELGLRVMEFNNGAEMWGYLCKHYDGTENATTRALTQRTVYNPLLCARCRLNPDIRGHLAYMWRLRDQLEA
ncbi:hypothetical protein PHMEG_0007115 [Phytophthora megakarya]|uniref:Uncharacterized protein n=1 Tax=Phytophthora megakarya TaxID=4795 RepID=A0A225WNA5_9STRA|nr:hypothetical protein PHMEG_0007115 [Phytophthora megakarya]